MVFKLDFVTVHHDYIVSRGSACGNAAMLLATGNVSVHSGISITDVTCKHRYKHTLSIDIYSVLNACYAQKLFAVVVFTGLSRLSLAYLMLCVVLLSTCDLLSAILLGKLLCIM
jgi:hypothetical protein